MRLVSLSFVVVAGCSVPFGTARPDLSQAEFAQEVAVARAVFQQIQPVSIREGIEHCGLIGFDARGVLVATTPEPGDVDSCEIFNQGRIAIVTASYHTHGAFAFEYFNELPSMTDVEGDEADGIDGYVATPGGRLWYVDSSERVLRQLCGIGCLPSDPQFVVGNDGVIAQSYTYEALAKKQDE